MVPTLLSNLKLFGIKPVLLFPLSLRGKEMLEGCSSASDTAPHCNPGQLPRQAYEVFRCSPRLYWARAMLSCPCLNLVSLLTFSQCGGNNWGEGKFGEIKGKGLISTWQLINFWLVRFWTSFPRHRVPNPVPTICSLQALVSLLPKWRSKSVTEEYSQSSMENLNMGKMEISTINWHKQTAKI